MEQKTFSDAQLVKKFIAFYITRRCIAMFTTGHKRSLSQLIWIKFPPSHLISLRLILISSSKVHLQLRSFLFPSDFGTKINCIFFISPILFGSRDSVVGIATSYGLDDRGIGVRVPVGSIIFSSPDRPDRLWGAPNLLSNGYRGLYPRRKATGASNWPLTSN
jgi:hypothetical protein